MQGWEARGGGWCATKVVKTRRALTAVAQWFNGRASLNTCQSLMLKKEKDRSKKVKEHVPDTFVHYGYSCSVVLTYRQLRHEVFALRYTDTVKKYVPDTFIHYWYSCSVVLTYRQPRLEVFAARYTDTAAAYPYTPLLLSAQRATHVDSVLT